MALTDKQIIEKAKRTEYKHSKFFLEGGKSVYDAMSSFVKSGDFSLTLPRNITHASQIDGYTGVTEKEAIVQWLIDTKQYNKLVLKYMGKEGGTDRGKLKIQTYLILKGYTDVDKDKQMKYSVLLSSCGNIDYGQDPYDVYNGVPNRVYYANTKEELQQEVRRFIDENNLGAGNYSGGQVRDSNGKEIGYISYNGRYWDKEEHDRLFNLS